MKPTVRIIRPSSRESQDLLTDRLADFLKRGFYVIHDPLPIDSSWTYASASADIRTAALVDALCEEKSNLVVCARGGYGASDLLPHLPWKKLRNTPPKLLIGFSDISALHSGLYAQLGWHGLHGPMPATTLWKDSTAGASDLEALFSNMTHWLSGECSGSIPVQPIGSKSSQSLSGRLFGGCFTVLTNLIGTPYFPESLADHIIFIEDTDEHPARLMRALNQWLQSGLLEQAKALVVGHLRNLGPNIPDCAPFVLEQFAARAPIPVFHSPLFGHINPNFPLMVGADAQIVNNRLNWQAKRGITSENLGSATT